MAKGYFIRKGVKTSCGGEVLDTDTRVTMFGFAHAREGDPVSSNHLSYLSGIPSGAAEAIELTLASQCRRIDDGRTVGFSNSLTANLADINQRMPFVLRAADQFDDLLRSNQRGQIEQSIRDIAWGGGVR
jgi:hypothetical protein